MNPLVDRWFGSAPATAPLACVLALVFLVFPGVLAAQSAEADDGVDESYLFEDVEPVFAASRYDQAIEDVPSSVTVVTRDEIRRQGYRSLTEILANTTGFYTPDDRTYEYVGVRGFQRPGDYDNRLLLLVDGVPLNDPIYATAPVGTTCPVDVALIERVEIVRGPSSSLYGTSAFFGVVNVITRKGRDVAGAEVEAGGGSPWLFKGRTTWGKRFADGPEVLVSAAATERRGYSSLYFPEFDTPGTNNGRAQDLDGGRTLNALATVRWKDVIAQGGFAYARKAVPTASYGTVFNDPRARVIDLTGYVRLGYSGLLAKSFSLSGNVSYLHYAYAGDYPYDWSTAGDRSDVRVNHDGSEGDRVLADVLARFSPLDRLSIIVGAEGRYRMRIHQYTYYHGAPGTQLDDARTHVSGAAFTQAEWRIVAPLVLNAGVRLDASRLLGATANPRVALLYSPLAATRFKLLYGRAFREPTAYELYYNDSNQTQKPGGDLSPENIQTFEAVFEQDVARLLHASLSVFYYRTRNLIDLVTDPVDGLLVFRNVSGIDACGGEAEVSTHFDFGLRAQAGFSYVHPYYSGGAGDDPVANAPTHSANAHVSMPFWGEHLVASSGLRLLSPRWTVKGDRTGVLVEWDATLLAQGLLPGLDLTAKVRNLLNRSVGDPVSAEHLQSAVARDGVSFWLGALYAF